MIGGIIIGISRRDGQAHVNLAECPHHPKHKIDECPNPQTLCVYTDETKVGGGMVELQLKDSIWWQSGRCYWTPAAAVGKSGRSSVDYDIALNKIGFSH